MISKIGNQPNSPNFTGIFKLVDPRLESKGLPTELYQRLVEEVQVPFGFPIYNFDFFSCAKERDIDIITKLNELDIKYLYSNKNLFEFPGKSSLVRQRHAYKYFKQDIFTRKKKG